MPFRDAYKQLGLAIESGNYQYNTHLDHTHEGSIGNLCNDQIKESMQAVLGRFNFSGVNTVVEQLLR
jgi:argininosuccinate lyase